MPPTPSTSSVSPVDETQTELYALLSSLTPTPSNPHIKKLKALTRFKSYLDVNADPSTSSSTSKTNFLKSPLARNSSMRQVIKPLREIYDDDITILFAGTIERSYSNGLLSRCGDFSDSLNAATAAAANSGGRDSFRSSGGGFKRSCKDCLDFVAWLVFNAVVDDGNDDVDVSKKKKKTANNNSFNDSDDDEDDDYDDNDYTDGSSFSQLDDLTRSPSIFQTTFLTLTLSDFQKIRLHDHLREFKDKSRSGSRLSACRLIHLILARGVEVEPNVKSFKRTSSKDKDNDKDDSTSTNIITLEMLLETIDLQMNYKAWLNGNEELRRARDLNRADHRTSTSSVAVAVAVVVQDDKKTKTKTTPIKEQQHTTNKVNHTPLPSPSPSSPETTTATASLSPPPKKSPLQNKTKTKQQTNEDVLGIQMNLTSKKCHFQNAPVTWTTSPMSTLDASKYTPYANGGLSETLSYEEMLSFSSAKTNNSASDLKTQLETLENKEIKLKAEKERLKSLTRDPLGIRAANFDLRGLQISRLGVNKIGNIHPSRNAEKEEKSVLPTDVNFDPILFLTLVHPQASYNQLTEALQRLNSLSHNHSMRLQELVNDNFKLFLECLEGVEWINLNLIDETTKTSVLPLSHRTIKAPIEHFNERLNTLKQLTVKSESLASLSFSPLLNTTLKIRQTKNAMVILSRISHILSIPRIMQGHLNQGRIQDAVFCFRGIQSLNSSQSYDHGSESGGVDILKEVKVKARHAAMMARDALIVVLVCESSGVNDLVCAVRDLIDLEGYFPTNEDGKNENDVRVENPALLSLKAQAGHMRNMFVNLQGEYVKVVGEAEARFGKSKDQGQGQALTSEVSKLRIHFIQSISTTLNAFLPKLMKLCTLAYEREKRTHHHKKSPEPEETVAHIIKHQISKTVSSAVSFAAGLALGLKGFGLSRKYDTAEATDLRRFERARSKRKSGHSKKIHVLEVKSSDSLSFELPFELHGAGAGAGACAAAAAATAGDIQAKAIHRLTRQPLPQGFDVQAALLLSGINEVIGIGVVGSGGGFGGNLANNLSADNDIDGDASDNDDKDDNGGHGYRPEKLKIPISLRYALYLSNTLTSLLHAHIIFSILHLLKVKVGYDSRTFGLCRLGCTTGGVGWVVECLGFGGARREVQVHDNMNTNNTNNALTLTTYVNQIHHVNFIFNQSGGGGGMTNVVVDGVKQCLIEIASGLQSFRLTESHGNLLKSELKVLKEVARGLGGRGSSGLSGLRRVVEGVGVDLYDEDEEGDLMGERCLRELEEETFKSVMVNVEVQVKEGEDEDEDEDEDGGGVRAFPGYLANVLVAILKVRSLVTEILGVDLRRPVDIGDETYLNLIMKSVCEGVVKGVVDGARMEWSEKKMRERREEVSFLVKVLKRWVNGGGGGGDGGLGVSGRVYVMALE